MWVPSDLKQINHLLMKTSIKISMIAALTFFVLAACNRTEDTSTKSIEGTYIGSLTTDGSKRVSVVVSGNESATAEVTKTDDGLVKVHCFGDELDTTFLLNYYENYDSVMVCLTGDDFNLMYGHMKGQGHMTGGMMGDIVPGETEWMHHMYDEHQEGDEHFGGFDMISHTFGYSFKMMEGDSTYYLKFQGVKQ